VELFEPETSGGTVSGPRQRGSRLNAAVTMRACSSAARGHLGLRLFLGWLRRSWTVPLRARQRRLPGTQQVHTRAGREKRSTGVRQSG
jgi:hypothetical protein